MQLIQLPDGKMPIAVMSHERSGTHFTMTMLQTSFGYVSDPWIDLDYNNFAINFFAPRILGGVLKQFANARPANLLKSHHEFAFFRQIIAALEGSLRFVYVYRHPAAVMASYWRFLHSWEWLEGPRVATSLDLARAEPLGQLMRFQHRQYATMLDRWANHVSGWIDAAQQHEHILVVRYADLNGDYGKAVDDLAGVLGETPRDRTKPEPDALRTVQAGPVPFDPPADADNREAVTELAWRSYPELMTRLGYSGGKISDIPPQRWTRREPRTWAPNATAP